MELNNYNKHKTIEVCLSPAMIHLYDIRHSIVVVIDVLRASSSMCVAFANGAERIVPVMSLDESMSYKNKGYIVGAERNGEMIDGFDLGNSPFSYTVEKVKGKSIALTTSNGTRAIQAAKTAHQVVIGSFLNLNILTDWLRAQDQNVICLCSGWKNVFNLEDTLFAGAVVNRLISEFEYSSNCDSAIAAQHLYNLSRNDMYKFLENSSHRKRLERLHIEEDIRFCLTPNQAPVIPVLAGDELVNMNVLQDVRS